MSVIGEALRRAEATGGKTRTDSPVARQSKEGVRSAPRIDHGGAWSVSTPRWRPSVATVILLILAAYTLYAVTRPGWPSGFRSVAEASASKGMPVPKQTTPRSIVNATTASSPTSPLEAAATDPRATETGRLMAMQGVQAPLTAIAALPDTPASANPVTVQTNPHADDPSAPEPSAEAPPSAEPPLDRLVVEGVMLSGQTKLAVVNGAIIEVGQQVGGMTVTNITSRGITVEWSGRSYRVPLHAQSPR